MSLRAAVSSQVVDLLTSPGLRDFRRGVAEWKRRLGGRSHEVHYFHQPDDPYSHLAAQILPAFLADYDVALVPHLVGEAEAVPEPAMLAAYARKDAADVAPAFGLSFPAAAEAPPPDLVRMAARLLTGLSAEVFVERAAPVGEALWAGDRGGLEKLAQRFSPADDATVRAAVEEGSARRRKLGHYSGGTFYYGGEWYWGVDRLDHLEARLRGLGLYRHHQDAPMLVGRPEPVVSAGRAAGVQPVLEYFPSLRSPYTSISMERVFDLPRRFDIELRLRPVLPMLMRGMTIPFYKSLYIMRDTRREAEREGVRFGLMCDPLGEPVERGFSLFPHARARGRAAEYLLSFSRGVFADGIDAGSEAGLRQIAERAGLIWDEARVHLGKEEWRPELEANREAMFAAGLWGVPSFRIVAGGGFPEFATWGQDRIWLVEQELARRLAASTAEADRA